MLTIGLILFREILEISLLLSLVVAATKDFSQRSLAISIGCVIGITASIIFGLLITEISNSFEGRGQELFEICILLLSIILIFITINWIRKDTRLKKEEWYTCLSEKKKFLTISLITSLMILREGIEIFLFIYGAFLSKQVNSFHIILGVTYGIALGVPFNWALYYGLINVSRKYLFNITTWLLTFLAAGMGSRIGNLLISIDLLSFEPKPLWNSSFLISNYSVVGRMLGNIFGYNAKPNLVEIIFYITTISFLHVNKIRSFLKKNLKTSPATLNVREDN
jgi:high-affinity iron transporter